MNKAAKITLWFDKFESEDSHYDLLKQALKLNCSIGMVGVKYTSKIGQLISDNSDLIHECTYENLKPNDIVYFDNKSYKISSSLQVFQLEVVVKDPENNPLVLQIGQFKTVDELKRPILKF